MKIYEGKLSAQCPDCGKFVQLNKFIFGALHFCDAIKVKR